MVRTEEENETMRACGCHAGRPCTCEMSKQIVSTELFACGGCVNCRLNIRERTRPKLKASGPRRCLKSADYFAELAFDRVILRENCVFRMRKPDWNVDEKTTMYNKLHQMRLAMIQTRAVSIATIDAQKKLRTKYFHDLNKTQEAVKNMEKMKIEAQSTRRMTKEQQRVDSDAFDTFSKQLVDAETLLPDLKARLEKANTTIVTEQRNIKIIREYVRDFAVRKLQATVRAFLRFRRWKIVLKIFRELSAVLEIQAIWRMFIAKKQKLFLLQLRHDEAKTNAACVIQHFSLKVIKRKHRKEKIFTKKADPVTAARMQSSFEILHDIFGRFVLHNALVTWKDKTFKARDQTHRETLASAIIIQRIYRGFRDRVFLKRIKIRRSLTDRVGALVDQFIVSGDFWRFILEIDADYRRFKHKIEEEETDATTFMSTVFRQRKLDEDQMMQDWFTASALQNPLVSGMDQVTKMYSTEEGNSSGSSVSQAMLHSTLVEDLVALSPNKRQDDLFPADFPSKVIRQAMAKGFSLDEVVAVMRGLQAQGKNIEDSDLVLLTLQKRSPLMTNPWISERVLRETRNRGKTPAIIPDAKANCTTLAKKRGAKKRPNSFISENLLDSIPGGMNAPIARLLLVAALRCYDPGNRSEKGRFVSTEGRGRNSEMFQSYLITESPLLKIRSEQLAMEAVKPFLHTLLENRCYNAYDILYNVRGIGELVSWNIPCPLAKSIYNVIEEIHVQSSHISKRSIIREVRVSAAFERFLNIRKRERKNSPSSKHSKSVKVAVEASASHVEHSALLEVKAKLETEVLGLPLRDVSISASELLFKAAFLISGDAENSTTTDEYLRFLQTMLRYQADGDSEALRQLITARVARAKAIADQHSSNFQLFAVETAHDLMKNSLIPVLIRDEALQQKVTELLEPLGASGTNARLQLEEVITRSPRSTKLASLSPLIWHDNTAHDSLEKSAKIGISCKAPTSSREMLPRS